jgi:hypothetical protein
LQTFKKTHIMSNSSKVSPQVQKEYLLKQKAALKNSQLYNSVEEIAMLNVVFDEQITICDAKIAHELDVQDAINL